MPQLRKLAAASLAEVGVLYRAKMNGVEHSRGTRRTAGIARPAVEEPNVPQFIGFDDPPDTARDVFLRRAWSRARDYSARAARRWSQRRPAARLPGIAHQLSSWKTLLTIACFVGAAYLIGPRLFYTYSEHAVTNAPLITLAPPLAGTIQSIAPRIGQAVSEGDVVATVSNPVWDPTPVLEIEQRLRAAQARAEAAEKEIAGLKRLRDRLQRDYDAWHRSIGAVAELQVAEAQQRLDAAQARFKAAQINLSRYDRLANLQLVNLQRLTDIRRDYQVAQRDVLAAQATVDQAKQQQQTVTKIGITLGANDRPPTLQRIDEIDIHLATQSAVLAAAEGDVKTLEKQRGERLQQRERETREVLRSPVHGRVWQIFARPGEAVPANARVANILDCDHLGVTAIFNQRHIEGIVPDRRISVRLVGIGKRLWGRIARVNGYYKSDEHAAEAIALKPDEDASVIVWIALDKPLANCWVGLKAVARLE